MITLRLTSAFWVDVRLLEINGRWIASAETPYGSSLGLEARSAIERALEPFGGIVDELLASRPRESSPTWGSAVRIATNLRQPPRQRYQSLIGCESLTRRGLVGRAFHGSQIYK
jgi:hypothetical protein